MIFRKVILFMLCLIVAYSIQAQNKKPVNTIYTVPPVAVLSPLKIDSTNLKGEKFTEKDLLKMNLTIPPQSSFTKEIVADSEGFFMLERPFENSTFQLFSFYINSDRFAQGIVKVSSANLFEIYVDDKLIESKTTKENKLSDAKEAGIKLNPYPQNTRVVIKLLSSDKDTAPVGFKVTIENENKESPANFHTQNSDKRNIIFSDIIKGKRITDTRISPSGQYALISFRNSFGEKSISTIELLNLKTGSNVLLDTDNNKKQLNWMPQSEKLYYISNNDNSTNLITIDPTTLEETVLIKNVPDENIQFASNEKFLFYRQLEKEEESKSDLKLLKSPEDRQPGYGNRYFIYRYNISNGLSQRLTFGSHTTSIEDISTDSRYLLFSITDETVTERPFRKYSMYKLDLTDMSVDTLWQNEGFAHSALFSPDTKKVLILGSPEAFGGVGLNIAEGQIANSYNGQAFILDIQTKKIDPITKKFNPSIDNAFWNKSDNQIYLQTTDKDYVNIYKYNPDNKEFKHLQLNEDVIRSFKIAETTLSAIYMGVSVSNSTRAYSIDLKSMKSTLLSDPYKEQLEQLNLGEVKDWNFTNSAGTEISGRYYLPPSFDASQKYPMIVYYYGGTVPTARTLEGAYPPHVYAALGYVVYVIQPSGATGFGQQFSAMHVNAWGKRTAEDIIEGTKEFSKNHSFINDKKIGCIGASYGGFMTMYLQTQTDIFAAAVAHAGISSISSYWGEGYWGYTYSSGASAHSYPWNNTEMYVKQSPLFSADKINTPILLTHGLDDTNVPVGESIQMYTALKILGKPVEFIQIKGENHGIANYKRRMEWGNSIFAWFEKWLKDDNTWWNNLYPNSK